MKIHQLKENDRIIIYSKDRNEEGECGTVLKVYSSDLARVLVDGSAKELMINNNTYFDKLPISTKKIDYYEDCEKETVNSPNHYQFGNIETIDYCDEVSKTYPPLLARYASVIIEYTSRAPRKNGKEDIKKAKYYIERMLEKWDEADEQ